MENEKLIHDYHNDRLTGQERLSYEARLEIDTELAQEAKNYTDVKNALKEHERSDLKQMLQELEGTEEDLPEIPTEDSVSFGKKYRHIYIAAAVIVFAIIGFQFLEKDPSGQDLYASYYESYPNTLQPVTRGETVTDQLSKAFEAYETANFKKAVIFFNDVLDTQYDPNVAFYKAMALLNSGMDEEARLAIQRLKSENVAYEPQLYWYGALLSLKSSDTPRAKEQLDSLYQLKSGYKDSAVRSLRDELEK